MTKRNDGIPTLADGVPHIGQDHPSLGDILGAALRNTAQPKKQFGALKCEPERKYPALPKYLVSTFSSTGQPTKADLFVELCERRLSWNKERARQFLDVLILAILDPEGNLADQLPMVDADDLQRIHDTLADEGAVAAIKVIRDLFDCDVTQAQVYYNLKIVPTLMS